MDHIRTAWLGSREIGFQTWQPGDRLLYTPKPNYPPEQPPVIAFRIYTKFLEGSSRIGQLEGRIESLGLDEEEAAELARQEYFYSQNQLDQEAENILFAAATSGASI